MRHCLSLLLSASFILSLFLPFSPLKASDTETEKGEEKQLTQHPYSDSSNLSHLVQNDDPTEESTQSSASHDLPVPLADQNAGNNKRKRKHTSKEREEDEELEDEAPHKEPASSSIASSSSEQPVKKTKKKKKPLSSKASSAHSAHHNSPITPSFGALPLKLVEHILCHCDFLTFNRLKMVCRNLYHASQSRGFYLPEDSNEFREWVEKFKDNKTGTYNFSELLADFTGKSARTLDSNRTLLNLWEAYFTDVPEEDRLLGTHRLSQLQTTNYAIRNTGFTDEQETKRKLLLFQPYGMALCLLSLISSHEQYSILRRKEKAPSEKLTLEKYLRLPHLISSYPQPIPEVTELIDMRRTFGGKLRRQEIIKAFLTYNIERIKGFSNMRDTSYARLNDDINCLIDVPSEKIPTSILELHHQMLKLIPVLEDELQTYEQRMRDQIISEPSSAEMLAPLALNVLLIRNDLMKYYKVIFNFIAKRLGRHEHEPNFHRHCTNYERLIDKKRSGLGQRATADDCLDLCSAYEKIQLALLNLFNPSGDEKYKALYSKLALTEMNLTSQWIELLGDKATESHFKRVFASYWDALLDDKRPELKSISAYIKAKNYHLKRIELLGPNVKAGHYATATGICVKAGEYLIQKSCQENGEKREETITQALTWYKEALQFLSCMFEAQGVMHEEKWRRLREDLKDVSNFLKEQNQQQEAIQFDDFFERVSSEWQKSVIRDYELANED